MKQTPFNTRQRRRKSGSRIGRYDVVKGHHHFRLSYNSNSSGIPNQQSRQLEKLSERQQEEKGEIHRTETTKVKTRKTLTRNTILHVIHDSIFPFVDQPFSSESKIFPEQKQRTYM